MNMCVTVMTTASNSRATAICAAIMPMAGCSLGAGSWLKLFLCLASSFTQYSLAFLLTSVPSLRAPPRSSFGRGCPGHIKNSWVGARTLPGLEMSTGGSAVGSASVVSTGEDDGKRVARIQGFSDKVRTCQLLPRA